MKFDTAYIIGAILFVVAYFTALWPGHDVLATCVATVGSSVALLRYLHGPVQ